MQARFRLKAIGSNEIHYIQHSSMFLGRSRQCEISIDSGLLSRHHASISLVDENTVVLKDLDSTNGTFINSMRVLFPAILKHRDVVTVGDAKFIFTDSDLNENQSVVSYDFLKNTDSFGGESDSNNTVIQFKYSEDPIASIVRGKSVPDGQYKDVAKVVKKALSEKPLDANLTPAVFIIVSGNRLGDLIELKLPFGADRQWAIGRGELCDVVIEDQAVSSLHAHVVWDNGQWQILDNKSTNGVRVNDKKVTRSFIESGDKVVIGKVTLVFRIL